MSFTYPYRHAPEVAGRTQQLLVAVAGDVVNEIGMGGRPHGELLGVVWVGEERGARQGAGDGVVMTVSDGAPGPAMPNG